MSNPKPIAVAGSSARREELSALNQHPALSGIDELPASHRRFLGGFAGGVKRFLRGIVRHRLFPDYFNGEREFHQQLVRVLNELNAQIDTRNIRVGDQQSGALYSLEQKFQHRIDALERDIRSECSNLKTEQEVFRGQLATLESVVQGLERIAAMLGRHRTVERPVGVSASQMDSESAESYPDFSYYLLENRYRGSEQDIRERVSYYKQYFEVSELPLVEIGPGRGEFLLLCKENGIAAYGVETDAVMAERCREQGLDVRVADGISHLGTLPDRSLGGLIAVQVIEHLTQAQLKELLQQSLRVVVPGGKIVFETINTASLVALAQLRVVPAGAEMPG